jgi:2-keto-myo-inositol isomerase
MITDRRRFLATSLTVGGTALASALPTQTTDAANGIAAIPSDSTAARSVDSDGFRFCLNTSTIRGQELGIVEEIRVAAEAGYEGIEPWIRTIRQYLEDGGTTADLRKRIDDAGLTVESAIAFAQWITDDDDKRAAGLEEAKRDMELVRELGGTRIAAPPTGGQKGPLIDLYVVADRYRALLEVGDATGVVPQLEVWGFSANLSRLGDAVSVAVETGHPNACLLPDVFHVFKGGSDFAGLNLLSDAAIHVFHLNDYPAMPRPEEMNDSHRVYPGDGIAPLSQILNSIGGHGRRVAVSLELFNRDYWKQDALLVARTGLEKMKASVAAAIAIGGE